MEELENFVKNKLSFKVYAKVYAVQNQINIDSIYFFNEKGRSVARCPYLYLHTNLNVYSASDPLGVLFQSEASLLTSDGSPLPIGCV